MAKNGWESTKLSNIWEKMENPMHFEREMRPNRHIIENYGDLLPIIRRMKPTLWKHFFWSPVLCDCCCYGNVFAILSLFLLFQIFFTLPETCYFEKSTESEKTYGLSNDEFLTYDFYMAGYLTISILKDFFLGGFGKST